MTRWKRVTPGVTAVLLIVLFTGRTDIAQCQMHQHAGDTLGVVDFPVSCTGPARMEFNAAMTLLHHMTYPQARQKFESIAAHDSGCAMAYWGIAMTLFQPVWPTRPGPDNLRRGWELIQRATALNPPTEREQMLIAATAAFFRDPESADYWKRIHAWADDMEHCYAAFPEDHEVAALYALALVATVPPDQVSSPNNARAEDILTGILKENPRHPGAMHYLIHANDAPGREHESLDVLRAYEEIAPHNPHALHMPTHIYTRLGDWPAVVRGNIRAAEAALDFPAGDHGQYIWDEFPHAIEYLVYAYLQMGADDSAAAQLVRLHRTPGLEPTFKTAFHLASTRARYVLERKAWEEAAAVMPRESDQVDWNRFPWPEAISWFARGLGAAHTGRTAEAGKALDRLAELENAAAKEELFMRNMRVLCLGLDAWVAHAEGLEDSSVAIMVRAAELEASTPKHPVTPGGTLPAYELLGDLLLQQGKAEEAVAAYRRSLELYPLRLNSLLGAARASVASENHRAAEEYYRQLSGIADPASPREAIREANEFLSR